MDRTTPCDVFYTPGVDTVFLPHGRALNRLDILSNFAANMKVVTDIVEDPCKYMHIQLKVISGSLHLITQE